MSHSKRMARRGSIRIAPRPEIQQANAATVNKTTTTKIVVGWFTPTPSGRLRMKRPVAISSPPGHYSFLSAIVGSRRDARKAGSPAARIATAINSPAAESRVGTSFAFVL